MGDNLFKLLLRGVLVVVPRLVEGMPIALDTHRGLGHFGVQRVLGRLQKKFWWRGIGDTVVAVVKAFLPCARVEAGSLARSCSRCLHQG